eukprot:gnl/MRDRNA2_/MRDRNA2_153046_c0_seq1.p1 gnl/MRDRNA2_/MRDRNA2_153046_c0~~gnl/MRDRNA2_/MRDRNA2_153046_c0_seq1.p1  ORF type:complete len:469 (-),score=48.41 gnl/MRDRNA2_/MRDRNA2_153046_c0_seq1:27-1433(-)
MIAETKKQCPTWDSGLVTQLSLLLAVCIAEGSDSAVLGSTFKALEKEMGLTPAGLAIVALAQSVTTNLSAPVWGWMCDEGIASRKNLMMLGCAGWGAAMIGLGLSISYWQLVALRMFNGLFLACLYPLSQSWVADLVDSRLQGRVFGLVGAAHNAGTMLTAGVTTAYSQRLIMGFYGWRVMCFAVGSASWMLCLALFLFMQSKAKPCESSSPATLFQMVTTMSKHLRKGMQIPTFNILVLQGMFGSIPWVAMNFEIMYLQYLKFTDVQVGTMVSIWTAFGVFGPAIGGLIGDTLAKVSPNHGRPIVAQLSLGMATTLVVVFLGILPSVIESHVMWPYVACKIIFLMTANWCAAGVNRPILCEIVSTGHRASLIAWFVSIDNVVASFLGNGMVAYLAENVFGYQPTHLDVREMSEAARAVNAHALRTSLLCMEIMPFVLCFLMYTTLHFFYPRDRARVEGELEGIKSAV